MVCVRISEVRYGTEDAEDGSGGGANEAAQAGAAEPEFEQNDRESEQETDRRTEFLRHRKRTEVITGRDGERNEDNAHAEHVPKRSGLIFVFPRT